jgi:hypothetical protein
VSELVVLICTVLERRIDLICLDFYICLSEIPGNIGIEKVKVEKVERIESPPALKLRRIKVEEVFEPSEK